MNHRPIESDYNSLAAYTRALEAYCDRLEQPRHWVGLCWEDLTDDLVRSKFFRQGAAWAEAKLKDRNTHHERLA